MSVTKSKLILTGGQKKGKLHSITAECHIDHISKVVVRKSYLISTTALHREAISLLGWITTADPPLIWKFWRNQLSALNRLVLDAADTRASWRAATPLLGGSVPRCCSLAAHQLRIHFGLGGGGRWVSQFFFGFPTVCSFSNDWGLSTLGQATVACPGATIWRASVNRFKESHRSSRVRNSKELWGDAMAQVASGSLIGPFVLTKKGAPPSFP